MVLKGTKVLTERELYFLQGQDVINAFMNHKVIFSLKSFDENFIIKLQDYIDSYCQNRVVVVENPTKRGLVDLILYFEVMKDIENFTRNISVLEIKE
jgi:hypothetical protein